MKLAMDSEKEEESKPKAGFKKRRLRTSNSNCKFFKNRRCFNIRCNPQVRHGQSKTFDSIQILKYKKQICKQLSYLNAVNCAESVDVLIKKSHNKYFEENTGQIIG